MAIRNFLLSWVTRCLVFRGTHKPSTELVLAFRCHLPFLLPSECDCGPASGRNGSLGNSTELQVVSGQLLKRQRPVQLCTTHSSAPSALTTLLPVEKRCFKMPSSTLRICQDHTATASLLRRPYAFFHSCHHYPSPFLVMFALLWCTFYTPSS